MLRVLQIEPPEIELGNYLRVNQRVALRRDRGPRRLTEGTGDRTGHAASSGYLPQARSTSTVGGKNDFATIGCPGGRTHNRTVIEREAPDCTAPRRHDKNVVADSRDG